MPFVFDEAKPLEQAVERLSSKTPIGSLLKSADWEIVPIELRERAFFSATVTSAEFLQAAHDGIQEIAQLARRQGGEGAYQNPQALVADLMELAKKLGLGPEDPTKKGTLEDITSLRRLQLVVDHNVRSANEYARWKTEQDEDVLDAYPAQELVRIESREVPREWLARWENAGGKLHDGRMIALKNDRVWSKISRFGTPWPPFDYSSGMGLEDISRNEAEALGIIGIHDRVQPMEVSFNEELSSSVRNLSPRMQGALRACFEDQVRISDGRAEWVGNKGGSRR